MVVSVPVVVITKRKECRKLERKDFEAEEEKFRVVLFHEHPKTKEEHVKAWLDRWWNAKRSLIYAMGSIRVGSAACLDRIKDEEEADNSEGSISNDAASEDLEKERMLRHLAEKLHEAGFKNYFIYKPEPNLVSNYYNILGQALVEFDGEQWIGNPITQGDDCLGKLIAPINPNDETRIRFISNAYANNLITKEQAQDIDNGLIKLDDYRYVHFMNVIKDLFFVTPLADLQDNKLKGGMKIPKFLKIMFPPDKMLFHFPEFHQGFWERFDAIWSMFLQEYKTKGTVVLSAAPIDFLMMSETTTWSSCHAFNSGYASGGAAYAVDNVTLIGYSQRSKPIERFGVEFDDKSWRQLCHVDIANGAAVFGRHYPNSNTANAVTLRRIVNYMLADFHKVDRLWLKANGCGNLNYSNRYVYAETKGPKTRLKALMNEPSGMYGVHEMYCFGCGRLMDRPSFICGNCLANRNISRNGPDGPTNMIDNTYHYPVPDMDSVYVCPNCAAEFHGIHMIYIDGDDGVAQAICRDCYDAEYDRCTSCGLRTYQGDFVYVDDDAYCEGCHEDLFYNCDRCGRVDVRENGTFVEDRGETWCEDCTQDHTWYCENCDSSFSENEAETWVDSEQISICSHCYENNYFYCESCDEVYHNDNSVWIDGEAETVCTNCYENNYFHCESCEDIYHNDNWSEVYSIAHDRKINCCESCFENLTDENRRREAI